MNYIAVEFLFADFCCLGFLSMCKGALMMAIDIWLNVKNLQNQDGQENKITDQTRGYLYPKNRTLFLK